MPARFSIQHDQIHDAEAGRLLTLEDVVNELSLRGDLRDVTKCESCGSLISGEKEDSYCYGCCRQICQPCVEMFNHIDDESHRTGSLSDAIYVMKQELASQPPGLSREDGRRLREAFDDCYLKYHPDIPQRSDNLKRVILELTDSALGKGGGEGHCGHCEVWPDCKHIK